MNLCSTCSALLLALFLIKYTEKFKTEAADILWQQVGMNQTPRYSGVKIQLLPVFDINTHFPVRGIQVTIQCDLVTYSEVNKSVKPKVLHVLA